MADRSLRSAKYASTQGRAGRVCGYHTFERPSIDRVSATRQALGPSTRPETFVDSIRSSAAECEGAVCRSCYSRSESCEVGRGESDQAGCDTCGPAACWVEDRRGAGCKSVEGGSEDVWSFARGDAVVRPLARGNPVVCPLARGDTVICPLARREWPSVSPAECCWTSSEHALDFQDWSALVFACSSLAIALQGRVCCAVL
jgi:hypothetical protein